MSIKSDISKPDTQEGGEGDGGSPVQVSDKVILPKYEAIVSIW